MEMTFIYKDILKMVYAVNQEFDPRSFNLTLMESPRS
jgi:hypothetical protein